MRGGPERRRREGPTGRQGMGLLLGALVLPSCMLACRLGKKCLLPHMCFFHQRTRPHGL